ncbi:MAG: hypothetical protein QXQ35_08635 [Candidatus Nezhaarchaeales archaeon]
MGERVSTTPVSFSSAAPISSILRPAFSGVPNAKALVKYIISVISAIKHGGHKVRFYVTGDIAVAIRPALERLGVKLLPAQELKPPYVLFKLEDGEVVVEASDGKEEFTVGKASSYEFIGYLYETVLERLYPRKKITLEIGGDEGREGEGEEDEEVIYIDEYFKEEAAGSRGSDKH